MQPNKPHFFTPILPGFNHQLKIPIAFMEKLMGVEMVDGEEALLTSDMDVERRWRVKINGICFEDGWREFVRDHDLHGGDILVFRYDGGMVFHVLVFDSSTCEKEYPHSLPPPPPSSPPPPFGAVKDEKEEGSENLEENGKNNRVSKDRSGSSGSSQVLRSDEEESSSFIVKLKPHNLQYPTMLVPRKFARFNGLVNRNCMVTFRDEQGNCWELCLRHRKRNNAEVYILWSRFLHAKRLKVGDVCTFKCVSTGTKVVMDVTIFSSDGGATPASQIESPPLEPPIQNGKGNVSTPVTCDEDEARCFAVKMRHCHFASSMLFLPRDFARYNGLVNRFCMVTFIDENGECWQLSLRHKRHNGSEVYIRGGWCEFLNAENLKLGDVCRFKNVSKGKRVVFEVSILRANGETYFPSSIACERKYEKRRQKKEHRDKKNLDRSSGAPLCKNVEEAPSCPVKIGHYSFSRYILYVPAEFARSNNLTNRICRITLRDKIGRSWKVNLRQKSSSRVYFGAGWREFSNAKKLKMGDECTFKLVSTGEDIVMEVSISRANGENHFPSTACEKKYPHVQDDGGRQKQKNKSRNKKDLLSSSGRELPSFTVKMQHYNFSQSVMHIPQNFARENGFMNKDCWITLRNEQGMSWKVNMKHKNSSGRVYIGGGWREFSDAHKLKMGDVCTFKLVVSKGKYIVMEVSVSSFSS